MEKAGAANAHEPRWGGSAEAGAADAHDAGLIWGLRQKPVQLMRQGLEASAQAGEADAHDAGPDCGASAKACAADAHDAWLGLGASEKWQKPVRLMLMMLGRAWGLRQTPVQLIMMLGHNWDCRKNGKSRCS